jgi:ring-1,2-phenylacetyl-CoA epoxidase subunit PaaE
VPEDLREDFSYKAGQYLTFKVPGHPEERRSYSLCSSPLEGIWKVAVKQVKGGMFSTLANQDLKAGETLEVLAPLGNFCTDTAAENKKHYVFFAAGSGITPVISLIKYILATENQSTITLFYVNKNSSNIIFKEDLEAIKNKNLGRFSLNYLLSKERMDAALFQGRMDKEKCKALLNAFPELLRADAFFICGPLEMTENLLSLLDQEGIDHKKVHTELFTPPTKPAATAIETAITEGLVTDNMSQVSVKIDGVTIDFNLGYHGKSILDAATAQGADLPYSCKGGVCCTCRAKLIEGEVEMDVNYALEDDEIEDGFILTCQSHPRSGRIMVDFDQ